MKLDRVEGRFPEIAFRKTSQKLKEDKSQFRNACSSCRTNGGRCGRWKELRQKWKHLSKIIPSKDHCHPIFISFQTSMNAPNRKTTVHRQMLSKRLKLKTWLSPRWCFLYFHLAFASVTDIDQWHVQFHFRSWSLENRNMRSRFSVYSLMFEKKWR